MAKSRPCRICRKWFRPDPRVGSRQRTCSNPECQRERHRRDCADWHSRNPGYDLEERLRKQLHKIPRERKRQGSELGGPLHPRRQLDWDAARDAVSPQVVVVVEESLKVAIDYARDLVPA